VSPPLTPVISGVCTLAEHVSHLEDGEHRLGGSGTLRVGHKGGDELTTRVLLGAARQPPRVVRTGGLSRIGGRRQWMRRPKTPRIYVLVARPDGMVPLAVAHARRYLTTVSPSTGQSLLALKDGTPDRERPRRSLDATTAASSECTLTTARSTAGDGHSGHNASAAKSPVYKHSSDVHKGGVDPSAQLATTVTGEHLATGKGGCSGSPGRGEGVPGMVAGGGGDGARRRWRRASPRVVR